MVQASIERYLQFQAPQVVALYGDASDFLAVLETIYPDVRDRNWIIYQLISHPGPIIKVTPEAAIFRLFDNGTERTEGDIDLDEPYEIYTLTGQKLYQVSGHQGIWGRNSQDRNLFTCCELLDFYYLRYQSFGKPQIALIALSQFTPSRTLTESEAPIQTPQSRPTNYLLLTQAGFQSLNFYYLPTSPGIIPTTEAIINSPRAEFSTFTQSLTYEIKRSGWLVITDNQGALKTLTIQTGRGTDRFMTAATNLYYVLFDRSLPLKLRQAIPGFPNQPSALPIQLNLQIT